MYCYGIIKDDLVEAIQEIYEGAEMSRGWKATFLVLIPKNFDPNKWSHFRPISLCNVRYKILTKFIARRLETILQKIISVEQNAFVRGSNIKDCIGIA
jgi:hypothetical protein